MRHTRTNSIGRLRLQSRARSNSMDQNPHNRRPNAHSHRSRRTPDRRGQDRRPAPANPERPRNNATDVEQIMRDLRARIAQRHGIDLSQQQLQELAARRLEAVLDPRTVKPALLEELRRGAAGGDGNEAQPSAAGYDFTETTIYESHRGIIRLLRRIVNPLLMLFMNPNPIARALSAQSTINTDAAARAAEQTQRQNEWNALHFEILQRLVTEVTRVSLETQALSTRVESLVARVDFNDKRIRSYESVPAPSGRPVSRPAEQPVAPTPQTAPATDGIDEASGDGVRRKRRRRRGRRPGSAWPEGTAPTGAPGTAVPDDTERGEDDDASDEGSEQSPMESPRPLPGPAPTEPADGRTREGDASVPPPGVPSTLDR